MVEVEVLRTRSVECPTTWSATNAEARSYGARDVGLWVDERACSTNIESDKCLQTRARTQTRSRKRREMMRERDTRHYPNSLMM